MREEIGRGSEAEVNCARGASAGGQLRNVYLFEKRDLHGWQHLRNDRRSYAGSIGLHAALIQIERWRIIVVHSAAMPAAANCLKMQHEMAVHPCVGVCRLHAMDMRNDGREPPA